MSIELIDQVLDTNLRGPYILSCEVARRLIAAELPGRIVNISSIGAYNYWGNGAALYSISKAAIARMTEVLAVEWARNHINVNGIAPGAFASEMMDGMIGRMGDFSKHFPRKRIGDPAQLDSTLLYLCCARPRSSSPEPSSRSTTARSPLTTNLVFVPGTNAPGSDQRCLPKRTSRPGVAPVGSPSAKVCTPATNVAR